MPRLKDVMQCLEMLAPQHLAEGWDNIGLMVGHKGQEVKKVLCALDVNEAVIDEAIKEGAQCIVSHHPFLYAPIKSLDLDTPKGKLIEKLIMHQIAVYSMHTNYDIAPGGLNDYLCGLLGLKNVTILAPTGKRTFCKVCVYVPISHIEIVREKIIAINKCTIGNYKGCTFSSHGEGTFVPLDGSNPFIGKKDQVEKVAEQKIEFMEYKDEVATLMAQIKAVHPYEEVAYDVYDLQNISEPIGLGRIGEYSEPIVFNEFLNRVKQVFKVQYVRLTQEVRHPITKVAICSGSGSEFMKKAAGKADIYITGDMQFHKGQAA